MSFFGGFTRWRVSRRRFLIGGAGGVGLTVAWPVVKSRAFRLQVDGIRKAVADRADPRRALDARFINDRLHALMPEARLGIEETAHLFDDPNEAIFIDEVRESVCRVAVNKEQATVKIVVLLPAPAPLTRVQPVFGRALLGIAEDHPEALGYETFALTPDESAARLGVRLFPELTSELTSQRVWRLSVPSLEQVFSDTYVNHPDHRASGDATIDAVFPSARDRLTFPELLADGLEPHKVAQLWLGAPGQANTWVDITKTLDLKLQALGAHPSQLGPDIGDFVTEMARSAASEQDFEFGESFRRIIFETPG